MMDRLQVGYLCWKAAPAEMFTGKSMQRHHLSSPQYNKSIDFTGHVRIDTCQDLIGLLDTSQGLEFHAFWPHISWAKGERRE